MKFIDDFLNNITMYRLVLYYLIGLVVAAALFALFGLLPFTFISFVLSIIVLLAVCLTVNKSFSVLFKITTNVESVYITALILVLIIVPLKSFSDLGFYIMVGLLAMSSKYIVAINKKHIFNPAAFAVVLTAIGFNQGASWWVGSSPMFVFVLVGGFLVVRKLRRFDMVFNFLLVSLAVTLGISLLNGGDLLSKLQRTLLGTPLLFFAFIMLTEPLTTPPTKKLQAVYGAIVGFLFAPQVHLGSLYFTPEAALIIGNVYSYFVSSKERLTLKLSEKIEVAKDTYEYVFNISKRFAYIPGQYMEWTLGHKQPDARGNRRYFTLASSPTEDNIRLGIKFYKESSSFKKQLMLMEPGEELSASQLSGDFVLPKDKKKKLIFIAGGIGVTPFRSMIKYLIDTNQKRDIVLFYSSRTASEIAYKDIFDEAKRKLGIKTVYTVTDSSQVPLYWEGEAGLIDEQMVKEHAPDYKDSVYYLSGSHSLVSSFENMLDDIGIKKNNIVKDYFPGFA
jgi:ferredoxin-NADP reductase/Na+-translocating ferredoxin:NAD+ oxidoreductase RnfD subunit